MMRYIWAAIAAVLIFPILIMRKKKQEAVINREDLFNRNANQNELRIRYLYLEDKRKSGDAILIQSPDGYTMLLDSGKVSTGDQVDQYLETLDIDTLDLAVATHPHHDHIGGFHTILQTKKIKKIYRSNIPHNTPVLDVFNDLLEKENIETDYLEDGDTFKLGAHLRFDVLNPPKGTGPENYPDQLSTADINNLAIVLKMTYKNKTFLFTSDLYEKGEADLLERHRDDLKADFYDAPHHGATTSSTTEFIEAIDGDMVVLNANILQSRKILEKYKGYSEDVFAAGQHGNILVTSSGDDIKIYTEK